MGVIEFGFILFVPLLAITWLVERKPRNARRGRGHAR